MTRPNSDALDLSTEVSADNLYLDVVESPSFQWKGRPVLVTGGNGFIGRRLVDSLAIAGAKVTILTRLQGRLSTNHIPLLDTVEYRYGDLSDPDSIAGICAETDTLFHLAGYAHADDVSPSIAESPHWRVTVEGTHALLEQARASGVKRIAFVSSVKAMGEGGDVCLDEISVAEPDDHYGIAKRQAERIILSAGQRSGMHVSILRLPLVYGQDNRGNIPRMIAAIDAGRFPPLPETHNRRSMVHVDDVIQALLLVASRPEAGGQTYLVTDGQVYSTRQIELLIRWALGKPEPNWTVPMWVWQMGAWAGDISGWLLGRRLPLNSNVLGKLFGSAWYSDAKIRRDLGYVSRYTLVDALPAMVAQSRAGRPDVPSGH